MVRKWWVLGWVLAASVAWSEDWGVLQGVPAPETAWIVESSAVGLRLDDPNRLLFEELDLPIPIPSPELRGVDLGIDLESGRRLLEGPPEFDTIAPESLVGL